MNDSRTRAAEQIMREFAARTGISDAAGDIARRYLWTDAFAVFALLGLHRRTQNRQYLDWALRLADAVHHVLGRYRRDDARAGWLSGLSEDEGELRPTAGGLRIGKPLPERQSGEPFDEQLEWDRDGQYFHYLTKWMVALNRLSAVSGEVHYNLQAVDLAKAAHRAFLYETGAGRPKRMYWKMSSDLKHPLVPSMGKLDPLDGFVTFVQLRQTQRQLGLNFSELDVAGNEMRRICEEAPAWATADPLSLGGLLTETASIIRFIASGDLKMDVMLKMLIDHLLVDSQQGLAVLVRSGAVEGPAQSRLAFRELGLAIGLRAIQHLRTVLEQRPDRFGGAERATSLIRRVEPLAGFATTADHVEEFWRATENQRSSTWTGHFDINAVMLATTIVPEAYLGEADG
jgi:hypothetical protein